MIKINMDIQCIGCDKITNIKPDPNTGRIDAVTIQHEPGCNCQSYRIIGGGGEPFSPIRPIEPRK